MVGGVHLTFGGIKILWERVMNREVNSFNG